MMGVKRANRLVTSATRRICMVTMKGANGDAIRAAAACQLRMRDFNLRTDIRCYHLQAVKAESVNRSS